jgi:DNA-binding transcriptional LysR family regulator
MVSTHVQRLEKRFGLKLLNRTTRKVALTPAGAEYLGHCRRVFHEIRAAEDMLRRAQEQPEGRLRVDVPGSFGRHILLPALPDFLARYPRIKLELQLNERIVDLVQEEIDLTVRAGTVTDPNLVAQRISGSRWITCASPDYLAKRGRPRRLRISQPRADRFDTRRFPPAAALAGRRRCRPRSGPEYQRTITAAAASMLRPCTAPASRRRWTSSRRAHWPTVRSCWCCLKPHCGGRPCPSSTHPPRSAWRACASSRFPARAAGRRRAPHGGGDRTAAGAMNAGCASIAAPR